MFDVGFSELVLIFIIGLVVLGPKRLPIAIRTVMGWVRTIRGLAANVQNELAQELKLQELQDSIKKAEALNLSKLSPELEKTVSELKQSAEQMKNDLASTRAEIKALSDEEVAQIQNRLQKESDELQNSEQNVPLESAENQELSPDQIAELAEADEEKLMAYYPPDDDLASHDESSSQNQQQGKSNVS